MAGLTPRRNRARRHNHRPPYTTKHLRTTILRANAVDKHQRLRFRLLAAWIANGTPSSISSDRTLLVSSFVTSVTRSGEPDQCANPRRTSPVYSRRPDRNVPTRHTPVAFTIFTPSDHAPEHSRWVRVAGPRTAGLDEYRHHRGVRSPPFAFDKRHESVRLPLIFEMGAARSLRGRGGAKIVEALVHGYLSLTDAMIDARIFAHGKARSHLMGHGGGESATVDGFGNIDARGGAPRRAPSPSARRWRGLTRWCYEVCGIASCGCQLSCSQSPSDATTRPRHVYRRP